MGYSHEYYQVETDAKISDIEKYNILPHRATWVTFLEIVEKLTNDGFKVSYRKIEPIKSYLEYIREDNFIQLKYGNY